VGEEVDKPILLFDFDGVVNAWSTRAEELPDETWHSMVEVVGRQGPQMIRVVKGVPEAISRLEEKFECVWCTGWTDLVHTRLVPVIGFGATWPFVDLRDAPDYNETSIAALTMAGRPMWKLPALIPWVEKNAAGRALAWIEDDVKPDVIAWASERDANVAPTRIVYTQPHVGLTTAQVDKLIEWADSLEEATVS
jgi:hypothetical protein